MTGSAIGGYFELELNDRGTIYHDKAYQVNSGRNALELIFKCHSYTKVYLPYYSCDALLQPLHRAGIAYEFYAINRALLPVVASIQPTEALLFVNYFGIMDRHIPQLAEKFSNLIVDNAQAFFSHPVAKIPSFYSPRKFFGLPDGGLAYPGTTVAEVLPSAPLAPDRLSHLITRTESGAESGYADFQQNEQKFEGLPLGHLSRISKKLLRNIDFDKAKEMRRHNFTFLHAQLGKSNELLPLIDQATWEAPMVYPFLRQNNAALRTALQQERIYTATYWPNVKDWLPGRPQIEHHLVDNLIPLPIDQRYGEAEMSRIISICEDFEER